MRRDEAFSVEHHAVVDIELASGGVLVRAGANGRVLVSIDSSNPEAIEIDQVGDGISIRGKGRGRSARVALDVPVGTDVTVKGASLDVSGRGALGALRVKSASGDVSADDVVRADVAVSSGDIRLELVRDGGEFTSTSGDITVRSVGGRLSASLTSGDLQIDVLGGDADVESVSGDVAVRRCDGSVVTIRTVSGDIRLGLPSGIRVDPEITTMSGKVSLPEPAAPQRTEHRRAVRLRLRTVSGDIRIDRAR